MANAAKCKADVDAGSVSKRQTTVAGCK